MTNSEVVCAFYKKKKARSSTGNLISTGDKLFSYGTIIAQWTGVKTVFKNATKYNKNISKHQEYVCYYLDCIDKIPIGCDTLIV